jgi:nicotinamidase-related amidase
MARVIPKVVEICERRAEQTIFSRFVPALLPGTGHGRWARYYERWAGMTISEVGAEQIELVPELRRFVPPAETIDKGVYSPWLGSDLHPRLEARRCDTLVVTGGETDVCVLASALGAIDWGYRTIVVTDAVCSSADEGHDALMMLFTMRYGQQIETATTAEVLERWPTA